MERMFGPTFGSVLASALTSTGDVAHEGGCKS